MKHGVLTFSYRHFKGLATRLATQGVVDTNLGDNIQSLAVRNLLAEIGVPEQDILSIDRDSLADYDGDAVALVMNGCFYDHCFPLPPQVRPVFIGFQAAPKVLHRQADLLRAHQPIGCRDEATAIAVRDLGIAAHATGCLTLTFPRRMAKPEPGRVFVVYGSGVGALPAEVLGLMPPDLLMRTEFIYQRKPCHNLPLTTAQMADCEMQAAMLLRRYRDEADLVVTPLHHAGAPCMALGVPVVFARIANDPRFSFLSRIAPVHCRPFVHQIDWQPGPWNLSDRRSALVAVVREAIAGLG